MQCTSTQTLITPALPIFSGQTRMLLEEGPGPRGGRGCGGHRPRCGRGPPRAARCKAAAPWLQGGVVGRRQLERGKRPEGRAYFASISLRLFDWSLYLLPVWEKGQTNRSEQLNQHSISFRAFPHIQKIREILFLVLGWRGTNDISSGALVIMVKLTLKTKL